MNRSKRRFLALTAAGVAGGALAAWGAMRPASQVFGGLLRARLPGVDIPAEVVDSFVSDLRRYLAGRRRMGRFRRLQGLMLVHHYSPPSLTSRLRVRYRRQEEALLQHFLLSTDIMLDRDVLQGRKPVRYLRFWHQGLPCNNPFADLSLERHPA